MAEVTPLKKRSKPFGTSVKRTMNKVTAFSLYSTARRKNATWDLNRLKIQLDPKKYNKTKRFQLNLCWRHWLMLAIKKTPGKIISGRLSTVSRRTIMSQLKTKIQAIFHNKILCLPKNKIYYRLKSANPRQPKIALVLNVKILWATPNSFQGWKNTNRRLQSCTKSW